MSCKEGDSVIVFRLPGHGKAELISVSGPIAADFADFKDRDWSLRIERPDGVFFFVISNSRGGRLQVLFPPPSGETIGKLFLSDPPDGQIDLLCDVTMANQ
ncbi:hypothetical protein [Oryzifoliimicrobium ureilyticus]|uniref:hypothetical protein n=1 Tax=Oryzifoliimicrobium ureilyticus TaxID=3113724 RepID=UPI0030765D44